MSLNEQVLQLKNDWEMNERWAYVERPYTAEEVVKLRGSLQPEYTLARIGAEKLWNMLHKEDYVNCLGTLTGGQAVQGAQTIASPFARGREEGAAGEKRAPRAALPRPAHGDEGGAV